MASASEAQRDGDLLQHISRYCEDAMDAAKQAGSEALFMDSRLYQHAVAMCILEIGELAKHLSEGFLQEHAEIPWRAICRMRDMYAHHYHRTDPQQLWATVTMDLPVLKAFCDQLHKEKRRSGMIHASESSLFLCLPLWLYRQMLFTQPRSPHRKERSAPSSRAPCPADPSPRAPWRLQAESPRCLQAAGSSPGRAAAWRWMRPS